MATRTAIVTGASQGIGRAVALKLTHQFSSLVLVARNETALRETEQLVHESSKAVQTLVIVIDLKEKDAALHVVNATIDKFSRIDALVNVAGAVPQLDPF